MIKGHRMNLYKYKSLSDQTIDHLLDIIERNNLYFCHGKLLNDPFEGTIIGDKITQNLFQNSAILSLSRTNDNLLMWSHYAKSHYGFCFGFNHSKILESVNQNLNQLNESFLSHGNVLYSNTPPSVQKPLHQVDA